MVQEFLESKFTALSLTTSVGELKSQFVPVTDLNDAVVQEFLGSKFTNLSKGVIEHVRKRVGNRNLYLQEVAVITKVLTHEANRERDLLPSALAPTRYTWLQRISTCIFPDILLCEAYSAHAYS